ncbi:kinase-like domain-containing protein [Desarmillaria tabescens]|uniref:Kinase-like domain-containing protein n=1 Tax=Armillaria tabescens TaxID=1929756 RepID=A0AA39JXG6_ARMTA|nr:kinase-like domain-containing protein [Desarmillaria tabescens]KAK0449625.1 kinase-like domain-containing protein [Desarmillaria tabescens]
MPDESSKPAPIPDLSGTLLEDRLLFMECLGAGSFGKVYRAIDVTSHKDDPCIFAVKCLRKPERGSFEADLQRREFLSHLAASDHDNVVTLHEIIIDKPYVYVVLDLCAGGDMFRAIVTDGYFTQRTDRIKVAFLQILDALHYCHQHSVFHRDIKPENILFSKDHSQAFLADFGLATLEPYSDEHRCGSWEYMSPECIGKEFGFRGKLYSTRANDTWALGVLLVNMITARSPWAVARKKDKCFEAYLANNDYFLAVLPISEGANNIFKKIFDLDPSTRISLPQLRSEIVALDTFFSPAQDPVTSESMPIKPDKTSPRNSACLRRSGISIQPALSSRGIGLLSITPSFIDRIGLLVVKDIDPASPLSAPGPSAVETSVLAVPDASTSLMSAASSIAPITPETHAAVVPVEIEEVPGIPGNEDLESVVRKGHKFRDLRKPTWVRDVVPKSSFLQRFVQRLTPASRSIR